ncbi:hypothetical protein HYPSUDRAFT_52470 [Hypholoma sublateritium FD-334 SS-4]|uniref:C2H2-type domain-containing protein n=1 Tax=Hypholoma sublateritium (strain FD-334 SS-4) TaxID=945553 RepID=A0A0D2LG60_HYPSF|nr:hypothetical protein HYPSUDRAFT_52470 [Hypholoma sublateritium FD-334 SS-4]
MESFDFIFSKPQEDRNTFLKEQQYGVDVSASDGLVPLPAVATHSTDYEYSRFSGEISASYATTINELGVYATNEYSSQPGGPSLSDWIDESLFSDAGVTVNPPQQSFSHNGFDIMGETLYQNSDFSLSTGDVRRHIAASDIWDGEGIFHDVQAAMLPLCGLPSRVEVGTSSMPASIHQECDSLPSYSFCTSPDIPTVPHNAVASSSTHLLSDQTAPRKSLKRSRESECSTPSLTSAYSSSSSLTSPTSFADEDTSYSDTKERPAKRMRRRQRSSITGERERIPCQDPKCKFSANSSGDLKRHMQSLQHQVASFPCLIAGCKKVFTREDALKRHMQTVIHPRNCEAPALMGSASAAKKDKKSQRKGRK